MPTFPFSRRQPQASSSAQQSAPATPRSSTPLQSAGEDVPAAQPPESTALARMKALAGDSLEMLETVTRLAAEAAGDTAVPGLSIGLKSLAEILKRLQAMQTTVEGVETLKERIASLLAGLEEFRRQCPNQTLPEGMRSRLDALGKLWEDIGKRALKIKSRGKVRRFLKSDKDAKKLGGLISEINDSIQDRIVIQGILNVENYVHEIRKDVKAIKAFLHVELLPRHAKMAHYNSNSVRRSYLEGTRVDFLQSIYTWIDAARAQGFAVPSGGIVLWINGLGGTGKTTVAVSVAERCDGLEILGGSFFCSRSDAEYTISSSIIDQAPDILYLPKAGPPDFSRGPRRTTSDPGAGHMGWWLPKLSVFQHSTGRLSPPDSETSVVIRTQRFVSILPRIGCHNGPILW